MGDNLVLELCNSVEDLVRMNGLGRMGPIMDTLVNRMRDAGFDDETIRLALVEGKPAQFQHDVTGDDADCAEAIFKQSVKEWEAIGKLLISQTVAADIIAHHRQSAVEKATGELVDILVKVQRSINSIRTTGQLSDTMNIYAENVEKDITAALTKAAKGG